MLYCFLATKSRHSLQGHVRRQTGKPGPGTLVGPYKNRKTGTLAGPYKNRKTGTRDPSGTLEKLENRNPIIIIIIIFYYHHFIFC